MTNNDFEILPFGDFLLIKMIFYVVNIRTHLVTDLQHTQVPVWIVSMDCQYGLSIWIVSMDCLYGLSVWIAILDYQYGYGFPCTKHNLVGLGDK